jgi:hypothetical protein
MLVDGLLRPSSPVAEAFVWSVLGGAWTAKHKGVCFDAYKGRPATAAARAWTHQYSLCPTASFSVQKYGGHQAQLLVETWATRMNFFFAVFDRQKDIDFAYTQAHIDGVANSDEFERARELATGLARARFDAVASMAPLCKGK